MKLKKTKQNKISTRSFLFFALLFIFSFSYAQVGVGNTNPQATLDITAALPGSPQNNEGLLIPRIDVFPANPTAAQQGMLVYLTAPVASEGFYYWDDPSTSWIKLSTSSVERLNDLSDGKSDVAGSSIFIGQSAGSADDGTDNRNVGIGFESQENVIGTDGLPGDGFNNTSIGYRTLRANIAGFGNTALGNAALEFSTGNGNTAVGDQALNANTANQMTAVGWSALSKNTAGEYNTAVGWNALGANVTGDNNSAFGNAALLFNTADNNSAFGFSALRKTTTGAGNSAFGNGALYENTTGADNTAIGNLALTKNKGGTKNVAIGSGALTANTGGVQNTAVGNLTLTANKGGASNTAIGYNALGKNTGGASNTAVGQAAMLENLMGDNNVALGNGALRNIKNADDNTAIGRGAMFDTTTGTENTVVGSTAGYDLNGNSNVLLGSAAGRNVTGNGNVFIGYNAGLNAAFNTSTSKLLIQNSNSATPLIYGEFDNSILRVNGELQVAVPGGASNGYAFPIADGTADQILVTDGAGQLTFEDQAPDVSTFPIVRATISGGDQDLGAMDLGTWKKVAFDDDMINPTSTGEWVAVDNQFVVANAGVFRIEASFHTTMSQANTEFYGIAVYVDGALYQEYSTNHHWNKDPAQTSQVARQISCIADLTSGQTIEIRALSFVASLLLDDAPSKTNFTVERIR